MVSNGKSVSYRQDILQYNIQICDAMAAMVDPVLVFTNISFIYDNVEQGTPAMITLLLY